MRMSKQYELELRSLPFSKGDNQVIYVESEFNPEINKFISDHLEELKQIFSREFLDFCYVPEVCERFWEMSELDWFKMPYDRRMLRTYGTHLKTHEVFNSEVCAGEPVPPSLICNEYGSRKGEHLAFSAFHLDFSNLKNESMIMDEFRHIARAYSRKKTMEYKKDVKDQETVQLLDEMERIARALIVKGVKTQVFDEMISMLDQPSPMRVGWRGHIEIPEMGDMEIRLNPMQKALYNLFLNYPEGLLADEIVGHKKELLRLYSESSVLDTLDAIENAVDAVLSEDKQEFYVNVSRIKARFKEKLGPKMAEHYIIKKEDDGRYRISLPHDMVSWRSNVWKIERKDAE